MYEPRFTWVGADVFAHAQLSFMAAAMAAATIGAYSCGVYANVAAGPLFTPGAGAPGGAGTGRGGEGGSIASTGTLGGPSWHAMQCVSQA